ncbi:hypothetical protein [Thalassolituus marinus]|uniref:Uncharacterized protein n=1 Tax=Thalassolituus marinus TaxID=671053 RepID=A0ABS7ZVU3_9GAMM|nr:hypothetical protein [Thalassolituus marinus]MCA6065243.1 hypothetical protein [Thalassolituus marinus]
MSYPLLGSVRFPKLKDAKQRSFKLSGIEVSAALNPTATKWGVQREHSPSFNLYDHEKFITDKESVGYETCYSSIWDIKGIFGLGIKSYIQFRLLVAKCKDGQNLFLPGKLLDVVKSETSRQFNDERYYLDVTALQNVETWVINDIEFTYHMNEVEHSTHSNFIEYIWSVPITENHYLQFLFGFPKNGKTASHEAAIRSYCTSIMKTVQIDSPEWVGRERTTTASLSKDTHQVDDIEPLIWKREADTGSYLDFRREAAEKAKQTEEQQ